MSSDHFRSQNSERSVLSLNTIVLFLFSDLPRKSLGAVSAIYRGATCMAVPIPNPNITRPDVPDMRNK